MLYFYSKYYGFLLFSLLSSWLYGLILKKNSMVVFLHPRYFIEALFFLKNHSLFNFESLMDMWSLDYPESKKRFVLYYNLLSIRFGFSAIMGTYVSVGDSLISVTSIYSSASWFEREIWDLFGIFFFENGDLSRILTDYGFFGHPLSKDFPLVGFVELSYHEGSKQVILEEVELFQEFSFYSFSGV